MLTPVMSLVILIQSPISIRHGGRAGWIPDTAGYPLPRRVKLICWYNHSKPYSYIEHDDFLIKWYFGFFCYNSNYTG